MSNNKAVIDLAIIIPTFNEEHFIGRLLDSLAAQTVAPKELVVVDAYSKDKTIEEIKKRLASLAKRSWLRGRSHVKDGRSGRSKISSLRYFQIPKSTISRQRNFGVEKTSSEQLLFLDADMEFRQRDALEKYFKEVQMKKPDVAVASNLPDLSNWKNSIYFKAEDLAFKITRYFWPVITARNLYMFRKVFNRAGGFDEEVAVGEDQELVQRIIKTGGKLIFLKSVKLHTSVRRVEREGRRKYALKMILFGLNILLFGHKKSKVKYEFGHFKKPSR